MRKRICYKLEISLYIYVVLLIALLAQDPHRSSASRQVNGSAVAQQNGSLPVLSERANGVNSRYLSAASTASLAAATVAASANGVPSSSSSSSSSNGGSNSQQEANRNFLLHQQQQQQQQQSNSGNSQQSNQQSQVSPTVTPTTISNIANQQQQQVPQFNSAQGQQVLTNTPVMSTTFTYNPITGQFVPSDLATGSIITPSGFQNFLPTQQQQFLNQQSNPFGIQASGSSSSLGLPFNPYSQPQQQQQRFNLLPPPQISQQYQPFNQIGGFLNQYGVQQQQFSRRNGFGALAPTRLTTASGSSIYGQQQPIDDDSNYFQQQQATSGGGLINNADLSNNNFGLLDGSSSAYGGGNTYLIPNINHRQPPAYQGETNQIVSQPSSVSSAAAILQPTSFSTAFSGPPTSPSPSPSSSPYDTGAKNDQCLSADNRHGTCYQASECIKKGGTPMGKCGAQTQEFSGSSYVCCLFDITCGQFASERSVYFRNPNYPSTYDQSRMCRAKVGKLDKGICQFRLDLLRFDVAKPTNGNCSNDMFVVSGQNENYVIPKICGLNDGQHYYVGVDESGVITMHMMMMGYYRRNFDILITQIPCRSDYAAPAHCLQYYMGTHGTIKSFNYDDENLNSINYQQQQQQSQQQAAYEQLLLANQQQQHNQDGLSTIPGSLPASGPTAPYGLHIGGTASSGQLQQRQQLAAALQGGPQRVFNVYGASNAINQQDQYQYGGYPNDLDYTMCIRKESGFCSITYQLSRGEQGLQPFAVGHSLFGSGGAGTNDSLFSAGNGGGWHPVSTECRDDYLLIGGVRLCSGGGGQNNGQQNQFQSVADVQQPASIQFAQNGTILSSAGVRHHQSSSTINLQQQLHQQHSLLIQQLARLQQQAAAAAATGGVNASYGSNGNSNQANVAATSNLLLANNQQQQQQIGSNQNNGIIVANSNNNNNLEQQQAALVQQILMVQQQLGLLAQANGGNSANNQNNRYQQQPFDGGNQYSDTQGGAIITDTTPGPFILRFVSNMARNARGFHIDYRQNPCK